mmetsp:Transcript_24643/g.49031  ORF Transcript_24643/g.49031 Transcript_24643/m.49031 type:complete len:230 (+) Transcript_24643:1276-1965(+)
MHPRGRRHRWRRRGGGHHLDLRALDRRGFQRPPPRRGTCHRRTRGRRRRRSRRVLADGKPGDVHGRPGPCGAGHQRGGRGPGGRLALLPYGRPGRGGRCRRPCPGAAAGTGDQSSARRRTRAVHARGPRQSHREEYVERALRVPPAAPIARRGSGAVGHLQRREGGGVRGAARAARVPVPLPEGGRGRGGSRTPGVATRARDEEAPGGNGTDAASPRASIAHSLHRTIR